MNYRSDCKLERTQAEDVIAFEEVKILVDKRYVLMVQANISDNDFQRVRFNER